jgi:hypothetical protein
MSVNAKLNIQFQAQLLAYYVRIDNIRSDVEEKDFIHDANRE